MSVIINWVVYREGDRHYFSPNEPPAAVRNDPKNRVYKLATVMPDLGPADAVVKGMPLFGVPFDGKGGQKEEHDHVRLAVAHMTEALVHLDALRHQGAFAAVRYTLQGLTALLSAAADQLFHRLTRHEGVKTRWEDCLGDTKPEVP